MKKLIVMLTALVVVAVSAQAGLQSKYNSGEATGVDVNFGPADGPLVVKSILASSSGDTSTYITLYGRTGSGENLTVAATITQTVVYVDNADSQFAGSDIVVISYNDGAVGDDIVASVTTTNITLTTGLTQAATVDTRIYEVAAQGKIVIGTTAFNESGDALFATPSDSPLRAVMAGTNTALTVTVLK